MSSFGLKKSALPSKRCGNATGQLKIQSVSRKMFITFGAVVATRISAGLDEALTMRCQQLSGTENIEPRCHSKVCGFFWSSVQISVVPRPSTTTMISSYMWRSGVSAPAPGTSTT
jgi:hypothetical protein